MLLPQSQRELNAGRVTESSPKADTAASSASGLESHVVGVFRVTSLLCANSLLWYIQMPLWPLTPEGFLLQSWEKTNLFFQKQQSDDM